MKRLILLLVILSLVTGALLTFVFYRWPHMLPDPATHAGIAFVQAFSSPSPEDAADLELIYTFFGSVLASGVCMGAVVIAFKLLR